MNLPLTKTELQLLKELKYLLGIKPSITDIIEENIIADMEKYEDENYISAINRIAQEFTIVKNGNEHSR